MKLYSILLFSLTIFLFQGNDTQRKIISDGEFNYTFYVSTENHTTKKINRSYHWYKSGEIHSSFGDSSGNLLHGVFIKTYRNRNLAEKGGFNKGLKNRTWKKWYTNGNLYEISTWKNGLKTGNYSQFSEDGKLQIQGYYSNNLKHGAWIDHISNDTIRFKKGKKIENPKKLSERTSKQKFKGFVKNLFDKKSNDGFATPKKKPKGKTKKKRNRRDSNGTRTEKPKTKNQK